MLNICISAFTNKGTYRESNQDAILVNGLVMIDGEIHIMDQNACSCFVADGVGGNQAGEFASKFILEKIKNVDLITEDKYKPLHKINIELLIQSSLNYEIRGTATTLSGIIAGVDHFIIIHAGDSQIWVLRNDMLFKVTNDMVLNDIENNSPIVSYFGGTSDCLEFDSNIRVQEALDQDLFLICSDGLFKALSIKEVKSILQNDENLQSKSRALLNECLTIGAKDNVSAILVKIEK